MADTCNECMYLLADYDPKFQCAERPPPLPPYGSDGMGWHPGVELSWWCGKWAAWVAADVAVNAGDNQTACVGQPVVIPPSVLVTDASGRPAYDVEVTFAVTGGAGSITGAVQRTDRNGIATIGSWNMGTAAGANSLSATVAALPPAAINATGEAAIISLNGGDAQVAPAGSVLPIPPSVLVTDQALNPLEGVDVNFIVTGGGGSVQDGFATTDVNGIAAPTSWTLGAVPGPNTLGAYSQVTAAGSPVPFTATGT